MFLCSVFYAEGRYNEYHSSIMRVSIKLIMQSAVKRCVVLLNVVVTNNWHFTMIEFLTVLS